MEFSERAEILLFTGENVALKLNRLLRLSNISLSKIPPAQDIPLTGNLPLKGQDHVGVNKPIISRISIAVHTWPLCSAQILVHVVNPH